MTKNIDVIGRVEKVNFPDFGVNDIAAKVDTGADSSSIWASDVALTASGELSFKLFAPGSRFYSGKLLTVGTYRRTQVKNSFGTSELRYKVYLRIEIGPRRIKAWFTLADREGMNYPVLIGRRTLKNKFWVDVGKEEVTKNQKLKSSQVLILGAPAKRVQDFFNDVASVSKSKPEFVARSLSELSFWLAAGEVVVRENVTGRDLAEFDFAYFKTHKRYYEFAIAAAEYLKFNHIRFVDRELLTHVSYDKLSESIALNLNSIMTPKTVCGSSAFIMKNSQNIEKYVGRPFVLKEIGQDRGRQNYLLDSRKELGEILEDTNKKDIFLVQSYIKNDGYLRVYVFGSEVGLAVKRATVEHTNPRKRHLNNPAGGANASLVETKDLSPELCDLAVRAARCFNRQVVGVDLIQDEESGQWLVLEVNTAPQIRSGSFLAEKLTAFAKFIDIELDK